MSQTEEREVTDNISARRVKLVTWGSTLEMTETSGPVLRRVISL